MLYFSDFTQKYLSDNRGLLQLPEEKITESKSFLRKSITLNECKSILGRKYKICLHRMLPICSYILCHQSVSFIQLSSTYNYSMYSKHIFDIDTDISLCNTFTGQNHSDLYNEYLPLLQYELNRQTTQNEFRYHLKQDGSRPYAYFCSSENRHSNERKEILNSYFGKGKWQEWDRSASIYNLTYSYNTKKYIPNSIDLHAKINNAEFTSKEEREAFKLLNMTKYFSDARKVKKFISSMIEIQRKKNNNEVLKSKELTFYKNNLDRANAMCKLSNANTVQDLINWYIQKRDELIKTIGGKRLPKDAVFIMEGVVNLATMNDLNDLGYKTVSVYDGFYTECFDNDLIESIYQKNVTKYIIRR